MIDDFENHEARSSGELWSEICSSLPEPLVQEEDEEGQGDHDQFNDSFQPSSQVGVQSNGQMSLSSSQTKWEPMEDSDIYIASLENRLKRLKGQSSEVTSREMLRSLTQAKKECWDRFLHDTQTSELFQEGGDFDQSALEHLKRWLVPDKVAISAEELEYLLLPSHIRETTTTDQSQSEAAREAESQNPEEDDTHSPEK